ncbi:venom serine carboxypeptidase-like isoform X2 [Cylas formicarius]|uniref:venom serine carboxypeptidase-like isoform X2 n=1 Tax=Cylas formicarius TaxID=197179 RepID=UPI00295840D0|nr:venom serine carboxypeptidase-like isoform X2 [Cylas formicarius]
MAYLNICIVFASLGIIASASFPNVYPRIKNEKLNGDPGVPLFLTPLIEQNKIKDAQDAAQVHFNGFKNIKSFAGYLTVDKGFDSNMFFWFFPSQTDYTNAPVLLWLQGGPGASSLIGLFAEHGPFIVKPKHGLKLRPYAWTKTHSVLYIDNPVGTGYSFTNKGNAQNETKVGESYAGKYVPAIAYTIHQNNPSAKIKINLQGLSIGNGLCDPEHQLKYGDYLYQIGLIDLNTQQLVKNFEQQGIKYIQNKDFAKAFEVFDSLLNGDMNNHSSVFKNSTGFDNYFNFLYPIDPNDAEIKLLGAYVQRNDIRAAIHVGNTTFNGIAQDVETNLLTDVMQSVAPWISDLLESYRVLIYNGQLDIIVAYPLTVNFLQNLKFSGADQYKTAKRLKWFVAGEIAGYVKQAGNLTEILVRDAGHMVPADQPQWAFDMISRFTRNKPFQKSQ